MRITNVKRFIFSIILLSLFLSFLFSMMLSKVFSYTVPQYVSITVSEGDTLWSIASTLEGNINENIYHIKKINHLSSSILYVGQEIQIPVNSSKI